MKKWLAFAAAACAVAFAAPAAAAPPAGTHRDPVNTPMFAAWWEPNPGGWYSIDSSGVLSGPDYGPVAAGKPVMIDLAWVGQAYGHTKAVPGVDQLRLTVTKGAETVVAQTWAEGRAAWTSVFAWDGYWVDLLGPAPPFNPAIGAGTYGIKWENVLPAELVTPGVYHVRIDEHFGHVYNDLSWFSDDWARPVPLTPYTAQYEFSFTVA